MKVIAGILPLGLGFAAAVAPAPTRHGEAGIGQTGIAEAAEPKEIIGTQIRRQGFACDRPVSAEPDRQRSTANEAVWKLKCGNATYRVRLIPRKAAAVERIENE